MKPFNLFLDDLRNPSDAFVSGVRRKDLGLVATISLLVLTSTESHDWDIVRSYSEFENAINEYGIPSMVSFDHDLSFEHIQHYFKVTQLTNLIEYGNLSPKSTGYHCAQLLVQKCKEANVALPVWHVHSANSVGAVNIAKVLSDYENQRN